MVFASMGPSSAHRSQTSRPTKDGDRKIYHQDGVAVPLPPARVRAWFDVSR
jgi:hypothetical protein